MRFGVCTSVENIGLIEKTGYDYIELGVATVLPEKSEKEFLEIKKKINQYKIKPECFNGFLPGDLKIVGTEVDLERVRKYVFNAFKRISLLGGEIVVFGSGAARKIPDGFDRKRAIQQIIDFLNMVSEFAAKRNVKIAIEHLNKSETNIINTLKEGREICEAVNNDSIKLLLDFFHFNMENEPWEHLYPAMDKIIHVHIADGMSRSFPGNGDFDFKTLFDILKKHKYTGRISIECGWKNFPEECKKSFTYLQGFME